MFRFPKEFLYVCTRRGVRIQQLFWWQGCLCCLKFNGEMREHLGRNLTMSRMSATNYAIGKHYSQNELALKQMNRKIDKWTPEWESLFQ